MVWDRGTWDPEVDDVDAALKKGDLKFTLFGEKLKGSWVLVRTRGYGGGSGRSSWLLIKHRDQYASTRDIAEEEPHSVASGRSLAEIARESGGNVEKAASGDPAKQPAAVAARGSLRKASTTRARPRRKKAS